METLACCFYRSCAVVSLTKEKPHNSLQLSKQQAMLECIAGLSAQKPTRNHS